MDDSKKLKQHVALLPITTADKPWAAYQRELKDAIRDGDLEEFLQWPVIKNAMASGKNTANAEFDEMSIEDGYYNIPISEFGKPRVICGRDLNQVHQQYHIWRYEKATGRKIENEKRIYEFGGGYGCLCRLIRTLGYEGDYLSYDLPIMQALQSYYLQQHSLENSQVDKYRLIDHVKTVPGLFIALWSISESPIADRQVIEHLQETSSFMIAFQKKQYKIDNMEYFMDTAINLVDFKYSITKIEHLPGNYYFIGHRK